MKAVEIRPDPVEADEEETHPLKEFLFVLSGVVGIISFLGSVEGISYSGWVVYPTTALLCWLAWYLSWSRRLSFFLLAFGAVVLGGAAVVLWEDMFRSQMGHIMNCVAKGNDEGIMRVTETVLLFSVLLVFFIVLSELMLKSHEVLYFFTMLMVLLSPILGIQAGMSTILLLLVFQITFLVMQENPASGIRSTSGRSRRYALSVKSGAAAGGILLGLFFLITPVLFICSEGIYDYIYQIEGHIRSAMLRYSGRDTDPVTGGRVHNGNNYPTGTVQLDLEASQKPKEMLYLRGFAGGEYIGGDWTSSDDEALLTDIMLQQNWQDWLRLMETRFDGMYYLMNTNMQRGNPPNEITLTLKHYGGAYDNIFEPYYSQRSRRYYREEGDDVWYDYGYGNTREGYVYQYYEQPDMKIDWNNVAASFWPERDWFLEMQDAYMKVIRTAYTKVPTEILPRLTELCEKTPLTDQGEITAFILHTLQNNALYTLTPGWAPFNEDVVEYFLFEGGRGYCEHFAAAATLMYRLYGIPARYATGYLVSPDDFEEQESGVWTVSVTDQSAHAWTEIFVEDYGWTPVEVTPTENGGSRAFYPGFDNEALAKIWQTQGWEHKDVPLSEQTDWMEGDKEASRWEIEGFKRIGERFGTHEKWFYAFIACAVYSVCLLPLFLDYRRLVGLRKLEKAGCRSVFSRLLQMLQFEGILEGYDGTEEDFGDTLAGRVSVPAEDIVKMQAIVSQAAFGTRETGQEEEEFVWKMYMRLAEAVYKTLKWNGKLIFRYWKAFW